MNGTLAWLANGTIAIETGVSRPPNSAVTFSRCTSSRAASTPLAGLLSSSRTSNSTFLPSTPPLALISSMASESPRTIASPDLADWPDMAATRPSLTVSWAATGAAANRAIKPSAASGRAKGILRDMGNLCVNGRCVRTGKLRAKPYPLNLRENPRFAGPGAHPGGNIGSGPPILYAVLYTILDKIACYFWSGLCIVSRRSSSWRPYHAKRPRERCRNHRRNPRCGRGRKGLPARVDGARSPDRRALYRRRSRHHLHRRPQISPSARDHGAQRQALQMGEEEDGAHRRGGGRGGDHRLQSRHALRRMAGRNPLRRKPLRRPLCRPRRQDRANGCMERQCRAAPDQGGDRGLVFCRLRTLPRFGEDTGFASMPSERPTA